MTRKRGRKQTLIPEPLLQDYRDGKLGGADIAKQLKVSACTVYVCLRRQGVVVRRPGWLNGMKRQSIRIPDDELRKVLSGELSVTELARKRKVCYSTVRFRLMERFPEYRELLQNSKSLNKAQHEQRRQVIYEQWKTGLGMKDIASKHGICLERVRQIVAQELTKHQTQLPDGFTLSACVWCGEECVVRGIGAREVGCPACWKERKGS